MSATVFSFQTRVAYGELLATRAVSFQVQRERIVVVPFQVAPGERGEDQSFWARMSS